MNNYWKVILATMVIFGAGVVTGGLLVRQSQKVRPFPPAGLNQHPPTAQPQRPASGSSSRLDFLRRIQPQLNLSPDQHQQIERVFVESQERTRKLMEPVTPQIREELQRAKDEFRQILTPRQQRVFDTLLKQQQQPRRDPRRQPGSGPLPGGAPERPPLAPGQPPSQGT